MKILYISPLNIRLQKGDSIHFLEMGGNLQQFGNELLVICRGEKAEPRNLKFKYIPIIEVRYLTTFLVDFLSTIHLIFFLLMFKPDILYYRGVTLGGVISRIFNVPSVAEANGIYPDEIRIQQPRLYQFVGWFLRARERLNYLMANRVICVTEGIKRELAKNYGVKGKICEVVSNAANTDLFKPKDKISCRRELGLAENLFLLGFVGSFRSWVDLESLIKAICLIKGRGYDDIRCVLVGDGETRMDLERLVRKHGLNREVIFTGMRPYEEVVTFLNSFDVCIAPFKRERNSKIGLSPLKLYEYLASGRPVIASKLQGISEVIHTGKCGYLYEADDVEDLTSKIIQSYKERDKLDELGMNGRMLVEKRFSWETTARKVEGVLRQVLEEHSRR